MQSHIKLYIKGKKHIKKKKTWGTQHNQTHAHKQTTTVTQRIQLNKTKFRELIPISIKI